jgi:hypothetical protein
MSKKEVLVKKVLGMENSKFYTLNDKSGLLNGFTFPLPGQVWKLLLYKEIREYINKKELIENE